MYFVATTITTVGYGDITPVNVVERIFAIIFLFIGVMTFSVASGALSAVFTTYDSLQQNMKAKLEKLEKFRV